MDCEVEAGIYEVGLHDMGYYSEEVLYCYAHMSHQRLSSHYHFLDGVSAKIFIILWGIEALRVIEGQ